MIAIGSDHGGFELKTKVIAHLKEQGWSAKISVLTNLDSVTIPTSAVLSRKQLPAANAKRALSSARPVSVFPLLQTRSAHPLRSLP